MIKNSPIALQINDVVKRYGENVAVRNVSVSFARGRLHAVIGENGAGKSTLLQIAAGLVKPDHGTVTLDGNRLEPFTPRSALALGLGMVQQHFSLLESMTVLENMMLGYEPLRFGLLDFAAAENSLARVSRELGANLDPEARVSDLGVGDRQRLEIARVLYRGATILVLDEPTAVLVPSEVAALFVTLKRLILAGKTVIVVTHKLDEVLEFADTVSVMRKGSLVFSRDVDRSNSNDEKHVLARAVMGESISEVTGEARVSKDLATEEILVMKDVVVPPALNGISFSVRAGEIVGIAGVLGNGQSELVAVLSGQLKIDRGHMKMATRPAVVFEDRHREGLVKEAPLVDNLLLGEFERFSNFGILNQTKMNEEALKQAKIAEIVPLDLELDASSFSGGNQQKMVMARALVKTSRDETAERSRLLVLSQPTRGVDLGAAATIHRQIQTASASGVGVLVVSSDLDELRTLSDRILVMVHGKIVADVSPQTSNEQLGEWMLGRATP